MSAFHARYLGGACLFLSALYRRLHNWGRR